MLGVVAKTIGAVGIVAFAGLVDPSIASASSGAITSAPVFASASPATGAPARDPIVLAQGLDRDDRKRFRMDDSLGDPPTAAERKGGLDGMSGHGIGSYTGRGIGAYTGSGIGSYTGGGLGNLGGVPAPRTTLDGRGLNGGR